MRRANKMLTDAQKEDGEEPENAPLRIDYVKELERKMISTLGRKVKLCTKGAKKSVTLYFEDNDDLENLLEQLCGKDFLAQL